MSYIRVNKKYEILSVSLFCLEISLKRHLSNTLTVKNNKIYNKLSDI